MGITVKGLAALPARKWLTESFGRGAGSFRAYGSARGASFYFRYVRPDGKEDDLPLGAFDEKGRDGLTLAEAKAKAGALSRRYQAGERDLRTILESEQRAEERKRRAAEEAERAAAEAEQQRSSATLGALMAAYVEHLKSAGKPSWKQVEGLVERHLTKPFPDIVILVAEEVTVDDVMPAFHRLAKAGKLRQAEQLRSYLRAAYTSARKARHDAAMHAFAGFKISHNPLLELEVTRPKESVQKATEAAKERKWALSEEQLRAYWRRICAMPDPDGALLRFHLLTGGQRVQQLGRITRQNYDADQKTVTIFDTKGRRKVAYEHVVPLIPDAEKAMLAMAWKPAENGEPTRLGDYLFSVTYGFEPASYDVLHDRVQQVAAAMVAAKEIDRMFTPGIIRKTVETRLAAKKVSETERGHLLSHGLGSLQTRHYDAHEYDAEKREALETLRAMLS